MSRFTRNASVLAVSAFMAFGIVQPAKAAVTNTVSVSATAPSGVPGGVTGTASAAVDVVDQIATIALVKIGTLNDANGNGKADAGETITYTFAAKNIGNVTITNVVLTDPKVTPTDFALDGDEVPNGDSSDTPGAGWAVLAPGDSLIATAVYTLVTDDLDAGEVVNTASISASTIPGAPVTTSTTSTIPLVTDSSIALEKSGLLALGDGKADLGDVITYTFKVTNTGPTTLKNIKITDGKLELAMLNGATGLKELVQVASIPSDPITTASIAPEAVSPAAREPAAWHAPVPQEPAALSVSRRLVRLGSADAPFKAGDRIGIYFALTNTGDVPLLSLNVMQPGSEAYGSQLDYLAPNTRDASNVLFSYVLTQEDIDTGQVQLVSGVTATARGRMLVETLREPLSLLDVDDAGDVETASLTPAVVTSLAPGAVATFTATYALKQIDIDAGEVLNTATVTATNAMKAEISATASATVTVPQAPAMTVAKTSVLDLGSDATASVGDVVTYTFTLTNTGNTTLNDVLLSDPLPGLSLTFTPFGLFMPGDVKTFTGTYVLKQTDIDAAKIENQATASAVPSGGNTPIPDVKSDDPATATPNDKTVTKIPQVPKIALIKQVDTVADTNGNGMTDVGDTVTYKFSVKNTGNTKLFNIFVQDRDVKVVETPDPTVPTGISLDAGAEDSTTFKATYVLLQADADRGYYDNTADVHGFAADGTEAVDASDPTVYLENKPTQVKITPVPKLVILKPQPTYDDTNGNGFMDAGDKLTYTLRVTNTGNVTLNNVIVTDPQANNFSATIQQLDPGVPDNSVIVVYTITDQDVTNAKVENTAFANAIFKSIPASDTSHETDAAGNLATTTNIVAFPSISLIKPQPQIRDTPTLEDPAGDGVNNEGDTLIYTFVVKNTGNVSLTNITITDPLAITPTNPLGTVTGTLNKPLIPGQVDDSTFTFEYTLVTADIDAKKVVNTATVAATAPNNGSASDKSDDDSFTQNDPTETPLAAVIAPAIAMTKTYNIADTNGNGITDAGDTINFVFNVKNTGNVRLNNIVVDDPKLAYTGGIATLAKGATSSDLTASHIIIQDDIENGGYDNQASVKGSIGARIAEDLLSDDNDFAGSGPTNVKLERIARLALLKPEPLMNEDPLISDIKDDNENGSTDSGDTLTFRFEVYNTGNVPLYNVMVSDPSAVMLPGGPIPVLAPGAKDVVTFKATHVVTDVDARARKYVNRAEVTGTDKKPGSKPVTDFSDETSLTGDEPTVTPVLIINPALSKVANRAAIRRGERVEYTITATALGRGPYDIADILPAGMNFVEGSVSVDGKPFVPAVSGRTLTFTNITPDKKKRIITIKLSMIASASTTMQTGETINRARLYLNATGEFLADALARVIIKEEAIFDCGEIVGRVFDDLNSNGYMDDGEPGLPGVRVVTVKGLLVTTDKFGRFHVTCADVPNAQIGSNFLMKLDTRTLPAGYALTSENPRDVRLTRGKITKLNFGASKQRDVALDLTRDAFGSGLDLKPNYVAGLDRLVGLLSQGRGALTITYRCGAYAPIADDRVQAVSEVLQAKWKQEGGRKPLKITTRVECGK